MDKAKKREIRQRRKMIIKLQNKLRNGLKLNVIDAMMRKKEEAEKKPAGQTGGGQVIYCAPGLDGTVKRTTTE